ncbi:coatomer subunit beta-1-like [Trifolium medium]|uniref:Coatomer subunit beta-1-like n=1 Tax=Trifolium medium TaxID=97028 RepID=A0A392NV67_9FABA|nr:coatomer subunit beta-1-like [Trifolium medium]
MLLNGETIPQLFITVICYVLTCDNHTPFRNFSLKSPTTPRQMCRKSKSEIMVDMVMHVLRPVSTPNLDIRRKTIDIALEHITPKNIDQVVMMLVQAIHTC